MIPLITDNSSSVAAQSSPLWPLGVRYHCFPGLESLALHPHLCGFFCDLTAVPLGTPFLGPAQVRALWYQPSSLQLASAEPCGPRRPLTASALSFTEVLKQHMLLKINPLTLSAGSGA